MWFGAEMPPPGSDALVYAVWGFAGIVVTQIVVLLAPVIKARFEKTPASTSPPQPAPADSSLVLAKDIGQLDQRADDSDHRFDQLDRAQAAARDDLDDVLDYLDDRDPDWRSR